MAREDGVEEALAAYLRELYRADRFGFTEGEYARAKADYLRELESQYNERENSKNNEYIGLYVRHFLDNEPIPGIENEYMMMTQIVPAIPLELINQTMEQYVSDENLVITVMGPEKDGLVYPSTEDLLALVNRVKQEELEPYVDEVSDEPLMGVLPTPGKIVAEDANGIFGTTVWTLSNGAKVVIKQTDFKQDEILMKGMSLGGTSLLPETEIVNIMNINSLLAIGGLGDFKRTDLDKMLAGKKVSAGLSLTNTTQTINATCSPQDLETMMQLVYLNFTAIREDDEAFVSFQNRTRTALENQQANPLAAFVDSMDVTLFNHHPRSMRMKAELVDRIDYQKGLEMSRDRYADASGFTFYFVGNVDRETLRPLVEQYLASLPSLYRNETFRDNQMDIVKGAVSNVFEKQQEKPKATITAIQSGTIPYTFENQMKMNVLTQILTMIYTEKVREDEGGAYYVSVHNSLGKYPKEVFLIQIFFETSPDKREKLMEIIYGELEEIAKNGPSQTELDKVKEFMYKKHEEDLKENGYWLGLLDEYYFTGVDMADGYNDLLEKITVRDLQQLMVELLSQNNRVEVVMISPE